jgi:hypothetical protein
MITPTLDPSGFSVIHNASPLSKVSWLMATTLGASLLKGVIPLSMLVVECVLLYAVLWTGKETPAPPVLRLVLGVGCFCSCSTFYLQTAPSEDGRKRLRARHAPQHGA